MTILFRKIHHLIRYFIILGILSFAGYAMQWQDNIFLLLNGPAIYIAQAIKNIVFSYLSNVPRSDTAELYIFLMPATIIYFGLTGFLLKQLWNERGFVRNFSIFMFVVFLGFIHWKTWHDLSAYFIHANHFNV